MVKYCRAVKREGVIIQKDPVNVYRCCIRRIDCVCRFFSSHPEMFKECKPRGARAWCYIRQQAQFGHLELWYEAYGLFLHDHSIVRKGWLCVVQDNS